MMITGRIGIGPGNSNYNDPGTIDQWFHEIGNWPVATSLDYSSGF